MTAPKHRPYRPKIGVITRWAEIEWSPNRRNGWAVGTKLWRTRKQAMAETGLHRTWFARLRIQVFA